MGRILSGQRSTFSGYLTSGILSSRRSTFSGYLTSGILFADVPPSPDISHSEFCPADVPPSPDISHPAPDAEWERRAFQLPRSDMFGSSDSAYPESIHNRQFRFPRQLGSLDTRESPDPFPPAIFYSS